MVIIHRKFIFGLLLVLACGSGFGQGHLYSEVSIDRSSVYIGEPVEVSVGIYTSTWFTKGVNFGNIKVNGAFTVYFRSVSSTKQVNGKNYAGVVAIYNVFPYDNRDLIFPGMEFTVETPNEGDSKGVKRVVKTKSRKINVKTIPKNYDPDEWLVASSVTVNESWQGDLKNVKVGNVIERNIFRRAYGTVSELIPPVKWDSIKGVSIYPTRADIKSEKSKTSISASRSEGARYLFEKEGTVVLPEITVTWWNARQKRFFKRTLKSQTIEVAANPDLGILETVRDSLQVAHQNINEGNEQEAETKIFGLSLRDLLQYAIIVLVLIYSSYRFFKWILIDKELLDRWKRKRAEALESEKHYFKIFLKQISANNKKEAINCLYQWIDRLELNEPTLDYFLSHYGSGQFSAQIKQTGQSENFDPFLDLKEIKLARKQFLKIKNKNSSEKSNNWINP